MAGILVTITVNGATQLRIKLESTSARLADLTIPMKEASLYMLGSINKNFVSGGRPITWQAKTTGEPSRLMDTGVLRASIVPEVGRFGFKLGTSVKYAAIHQFGGVTGPHQIFPRNSSALSFMWKGQRRFFKKVNHPGSKIPARPYLLFQDEDITLINKMVVDYINGV